MKTGLSRNSQSNALPENGPALRHVQTNEATSLRLFLRYVETLAFLPLRPPFVLKAG